MSMAFWADMVYNKNDKQLSGEIKMKVRLNEDAEIVKTVKEGLQHTGGYCPCKRDRTPDTRCMCKEFRDQIKDPDFYGYCHCLLYYKEKE
jgi:ferredoxin-thioredoxin reductase catalytic subunit